MTPLRRGRGSSVAWRALLVHLLLAPLLSSCGADRQGETAAPLEAVALEHQEDAVCGMLVREQSAPRAQVVHRDGSRFFFCSLGDMLVHLGAPSPHGSTAAVFVEVMEADEDPMQAHTNAHPWVAAADATYVVGIPRRGIMGEPVLAYADPGEAQRAMGGYGEARALDLAELRAWWAARGAETH